MSDRDPKPSEHEDRDARIEHSMERHAHILDRLADAGNRSDRNPSAVTPPTLERALWTLVMAARPKELASRGTPKQTRLAHEFGLHGYPWPRLLGEDVSKWRAVAKMLDKAAKHDHQQHCTGPFPPEMRGMRADPFVGEHAARHRRSMECAMVHLLAAGIPKWLMDDVGAESDVGDRTPTKDKTDP